MSILLLSKMTTLGFSFKYAQHMEEVKPWVEELSLRLHHVSSIERHRKYLRCLQHIEELRYVDVWGEKSNDNQVWMK